MNVSENQEQQPQNPTESAAEQEFSKAWAEELSEETGKPEEEDDLEQRLEDEDQPASPPAPAAPGSDDDGKGDEDLDAIRGEVDKLTQRLRSAEGRLRNQHSEKLKAEVAQMRQQLEQMQRLKDGEQRQQPAGNGGPADDEHFIPDGFTKDDWELFKRDFPDNAKAIKEQQLGAGTVDQRLAKLEQEREARELEAARQQFEAPILEKHPDYKDICTQQGAEVMEFVKAIDDPLKRQGAELVIQHGTPEQIIALVSDFKHWKANKGKPATQPKPTRDPSAATAVPSRGGSRASVAAGAPNKDDFDAAWHSAKVN